MVEPCHHDAGTVADNPEKTDRSQTNCQSQQVVSVAVKIAAFAAADVPLPAGRLDQFLTVQFTAPPLTASLSPHFKSPPLAIIHCRLLN